MQSLLEYGLIIASVKTGTLVLLLALAAWSDMRTRRIPNVLIATGVAAAVLMSAALEPVAPIRGMKPALYGAAAAFSCFFPMYLLRVMGAGDVKLMAAVGAFFEPWSAVLVVLAVLIAGGLLSILIALRRGIAHEAMTSTALIMSGIVSGPARGGGASGLSARADRGYRAISARQVPYAVAIAAGTLAVVAWRSVAG